MTDPSSQAWFCGLNSWDFREKMLNLLKESSKYKVAIQTFLLLWKTSDIMVYILEKKGQNLIFCQHSPSSRLSYLHSWMILRKMSDIKGEFERKNTKFVQPI